MADADKPRFDVEKAIEASSRKTSLRALQEKGYKNVRVLDHKKINELIGEAVAATFERLGPGFGGPSSESVDSGKLTAEAREEFLKLLYQNQQPPETVEQELRARVRTLESRVNDLLAELAGKDQELAVSKDAELAKLRSERQEAMDRLSGEQAKAASTGLMDDPRELAAALESGREDLVEARQQILELEAELATWEQGPDPKDLADRLKNLEQALVARDADLESLRKELSAQEEALRAEADRRVAELEEKLAKAPRVIGELAAKLLARLSDDKRRKKLMSVSPAAIEELKQPEEVLAVTLAAPLDETLVRYAADVDPLRRQVERLQAELASLKERGGQAPEAAEAGKEGEFLTPDLADVGLRRRGRHYVKRSDHFHRQTGGGEREAS